MSGCDGFFSDDGIVFGLGGGLLGGSLLGGGLLGGSLLGGSGLGGSGGSDFFGFFNNAGFSPFGISSCLPCIEISNT